MEPGLQLSSQRGKIRIRISKVKQIIMATNHLTVGIVKPRVDKISKMGSKKIRSHEISVTAYLLTNVYISERTREKDRIIYHPFTSKK